MVGSTKSESTIRNSFTPNTQVPGCANPRRRNTRTVSSRSSGSDSSHVARIGVLSPEAQTVLSGPGVASAGGLTGFSSGMSTGPPTVMPNVDDHRSQASKLGSDVERGSQLVHFSHRFRKILRCMYDTPLIQTSWGTKNKRDPMKNCQLIISYKLKGGSGFKPCRRISFPMHY